MYLRSGVYKLFEWLFVVLNISIHIPIRPRYIYPLVDTGPYVLFAYLSCIYTI